MRQKPHLSAGRQPSMRQLRTAWSEPSLGNSEWVQVSGIDETGQGLYVVSFGSPDQKLIPLGQKPARQQGLISERPDNSAQTDRSVGNMFRSGSRETFRRLVFNSAPISVLRCKFDPAVCYLIHAGAFSPASKALLKDRGTVLTVFSLSQAQ